MPCKKKSMNRLKFLPCPFYFFYIFTLFFILIIQGCAPLRPTTDPERDKKALIFAKKARLYNQHILSSKGTGWAILETDKKYEKLKIAWAVVFPDKIRITFLISANPIETIIATGKKITFISHTGKHKKHSYQSNNPDMKKYIHVPVRMSEIILLLLGRIPVKKIDDAYFLPSDQTLSTIVLRQKKKSVPQYLKFNDKQILHSLWSKNYKKQLIYQLMIKKYKTFTYETIPAKLEITDNNNRKITLEITNFISNPPIKKSVFLVQ